MPASLKSHPARTQSVYQTVDVQDLSGMGRPISLATAVARGWERAVGALSPRSPYRIGDAVLGDDPFNGRHEGTVVSLGSSARHS